MSTVVNLYIGGCVGDAPVVTSYELILQSPYTEPSPYLLVLRSAPDIAPITGEIAVTLTGATAQFTGTSFVFFTGDWESTLAGATAQFDGVVTAVSRWESTLEDATADFEGENPDMGRFNATMADAVASFDMRQVYDVSAEWASTMDPARSLVDMVFQSRYGLADLVLPEPILLGGSGTYGYAVLPELVYLATGEDQDNLRAELTLPAPELSIRTGAVGESVLPEPEYSVAATSPGFATASLECPAPLLTGYAWMGTSGFAALEWPAPNGVAYSGAYASLELLAPELTAQGNTAALATAAITLPFLELTATGKTGVVATVVLELPELTLAATGIVGGNGTAVLTLPALILASSGVATLTETTYAINLTSGAVTQLLLGEIDRLVTAHGRLYGLREGVLMRLDGDTDDTVAIAATVRFAPQQFGTLQAKRLSTVYLNAREDDGLTLDCLADETTRWRYQTPTDRAPAMGTHKIKTGRGVVFHSVGLQLHNRNGGRMDVGGMEILVEPLSRRPR